METEMNTAQNILNQGARAFDETKDRIGEAYGRSARAISHKYDQALDYGRQNPGKAAMIAFGVGIGVGILLLGSRRRSRVSRYGEPVVNALSNMAREFIKGL